MKRAVAALGLLAASCARNPASLELNVAELSARPAVIFVPGFYGSTLREKGGGRRIYYTAREALFGNNALSLYQKELATPAGPELEVEGVLGSVTVVPWAYEEIVYASFFARLRETFPEKQILPLAYDWRDDLQLAVARLDTLVRELEARGCRSIEIIAHSMGGEVVSYYLGYGTQPLATAHLNWAGAARVRRVVFLGTPFQGSLYAFRSFQKGSGLTLSDRLLPADTMASFPANFELLPRRGRFLDRAGREVNFDLFDATLWEHKGFGFFRPSALPAPVQEARRHFTRTWLARARAWFDKIQLGAGAPAHLKVLNVVGTGRRTLGYGYYLPEAPYAIFDPSDVKRQNLSMDRLWVDGDSSVETTSAEIPAALRPITQRVGTSYPHTQLFLDPTVEKEYKSFLSP